MRRKNIYDKIEENEPGYREADSDSETAVTWEAEDREYLDYIEGKGKNNGKRINNTVVATGNRLN